MRIKNCGVIHCIAECEDCGKEWQDFRDARAKAYAHAKSTGHSVWVETGTARMYNPKESDSE